MNQLHDYTTEFEQLIEIAEFLIANNEHKKLNMPDFLQMCLDIRNAERGDSEILHDLKNKNLVIPTEDILQ